MSILILAGVVFFTRLPFTACSPDSYWCNIAYAITNTGGTFGFFVVLVVTSFCYTLSSKALKDRIKIFFKSLITLLLFFGILAFINERYTKPILKSQRPSHVYMLNQTGLISAIDSLYGLDNKARKSFFDTLVKAHPLEFKQIDPEITQHWIDESGFSFPSGHTFNAFLFAMILSYAIYFNRSYPKWRNLFFVPFIWAVLIGVSRVAVGAHSATDVSAGALVGSSIGWIFLYIERTRHWLTRKN